MPNYIEKEAAVAEAKKRVEFALSANSRELLRTYNEVLKIINKQPVISIPEIVYCKDCANHGKCIFEDTFDTAHLQNGFCAAGTRKKNISQRNSAYIGNTTKICVNCRYYHKDTKPHCDCGGGMTANGDSDYCSLFNAKENKI